MGYDVHIARADNWFDSNEKPIPLPEWLRYVASDPEMRLDNIAIARIDGKPVLAVQSDGLAVWVAWSRHERDNNMAWFDWREGRIIMKNPDDEILAKMRLIATALSAFVVGDEHERY